MNKNKNTFRTGDTTHLLPGLHHTGCICQYVDVLVFVVLVYLGTWFKERLHEKVQESGNTDLQRKNQSRQRNSQSYLGLKLGIDQYRSFGADAIPIFRPPLLPIADIFFPIFCTF